MKWFYSYAGLLSSIIIGGSVDDTEQGYGAFSKYDPDGKPTRSCLPVDEKTGNRRFLGFFGNNESASF